MNNIPMPDVKVSECDKALEYEIHYVTFLSETLNTQRDKLQMLYFNSVTSPNDFNSTPFYHRGMQQN